MASCFEIVDGEYIEELKDKSKNENTKDSTKWWENVFKKWVNEKKTCKQIKKSTRTMSSINDRRSFKHSEIQ